MDAIDMERKSIMVYRQQDLKADLGRANEAAMAATLLGFALHPFEKQRDAMRQELHSLHLIQAVSQSASSDADTPTPEPSPPSENPSGTA